MSTESDARVRQHGPVNRLALALVDILTGETEAHVEKGVTYSGPKWTFHVKKAPVQDD